MNLSMDGAKFNKDRTRRHLLWRSWNADKPLCNFICLNPSTADEKRNDQSVLKMLGFSERLGAGCLVVTNIFDIRTTFPKDLYRRPIGELNSRANDKAIVEWANQAAFVVIAWGGHGALLNRGQAVLEILSGYDVRHRLLAIRINSDGTPAHPLMMPYNLTPKRFKL